MKARTYTEYDWAVRRWDRFTTGSKSRNGPRFQTPKSFCQFWRTVLLWATLASIPFVGKLFLSHLQVFSFAVDYERELAKKEARERRFNTYIMPIVRVVWTLLLPVRVIVVFIARGVGSVVEYIDDRDGLKHKLNNVFAGACLLVAAGALCVLAVLIVHALIESWQADMTFFLLILGSVVAGLVGLLVYIYFLGKMTIRVILAVLDALGSIFGLLWSVALVQKKRVCPPMEIVRRQRSF